MNVAIGAQQIVRSLMPLPGWQPGVTFICIRVSISCPDCYSCGDHQSLSDEWCVQAHSPHTHTHQYSCRRRKAPQKVCSSTSYGARFVCTLHGRASFQSVSKGATDGCALFFPFALRPGSRFHTNRSDFLPPSAASRRLPPPIRNKQSSKQAINQSTKQSINQQINQTSK